MNAIQAMGGNGEITLQARVTTQNQCEFVIRDTGPGVPHAIRESIFEPFFTTKPAGQGTGLGLAIVYELIGQNEAEIHLDSPPQGMMGAIFRMVFDFEQID